MDTRTAINQNLVYLEQNITDLPNILPHLIQNNIISRNEREEIESERTTQAKNATLLSILQRKNLPVNTFLDFLRVTNNQHCANKIQGFVSLVENITNLPVILFFLRQDDIISKDEKEEIGLKGTTMLKNAKLLNVVQKKSLPTEIFLEILRKTNNEHCVDFIEGIENKEELHVAKPKIMKNKWWPVDKILTESLQKRKIGNKLMVEELHEIILKDKNRMVVICESVDASKLTSMGGIGKTLTATWYAHHYEKEYNQVIWIDSGEGTLLTSFKKLARDVNVKYLDKMIDLEDYSTKSYEMLQDFKCLWIFDNAESYKGEEGIKEVLPKRKENFYCLITSRWREWGTLNIGYGKISRLELNIFEESESIEFLKTHLKMEIQHKEWQLKELSKLLGNLPLALQLAIAALNMGKIDLQNYIEKTSSEDVGNIVDGKLDDYEKTINGSVKISLDLIEKEKNGKTAADILMILGYIRPDNIEFKFIMAIMDVGSHIFDEAVLLLEKYSLVTKTGVDKETLDDGFTKKRPKRSKTTKVEMQLLSVHRLLQQVIRHNDRENERETLREILGCHGFVEYKLLPFTKYATNELRNEFPKVRAELLDQKQLVRLVKEKRFEESVQLAEFIDKELQRPATKFNHAICLEKNQQLEENIKVLEELYKQEMNEGMDYFSDDYIVEMGLLELETEVTKDLVGGHLLVSLWTMDNNNERLIEILEERKSFVMIHSEERMTALVRILYSNLIHSNYTLTYEERILKLVLGGDEKRIELFDCSVDLCGPLLRALSEMQKSLSERVHFTDGNPKDTKSEVSQVMSKILNTLEVSCNYSDVSLESISSFENITLVGGSLTLDSSNRICPTKLTLVDVSYFKNGKELSNVKVNEFIDFHQMKRLELICYNKKNLSIDLSEESANIAYPLLNRIDVLSLKSSDGNGRVIIKEAKIENCSLDLSILPPSLEKLSLFRPSNVFVSGEIDLPNLKYLKLKYGKVSQLSHFRSFQLTYLYLDWVKEMTVNMLNTLPSSKVIRISYVIVRNMKRLKGEAIQLDKLILDGFRLNKVKVIMTYFHPKQLVLSSSYEPDDLTQLIDKQIPTIAIGWVDWRNTDFKQSIISKKVDRESKYYLFHEGTGKAIERKEFEEVYLLNDTFKPDLTPPDLFVTF